MRRGFDRVKNAMTAGWNSLRGPTHEQRLELAGIRYGRDITRGYIEPLHYIQPQDKILIYQAAGSYEVYEDLLRDDRVHATFSQRRAAVVSRPWEVQPGGTRRLDRVAADFVKEQLTHLRWDDITNQMLYGVFYGFSVAEVMWGHDGAMVIPTSIRVRNRRRFVFRLGREDEDGVFAPRLLTTDNPNGEPLPPQKFWIFNTGADNDDEPYGRGLAHWLYWPIWFKKHHIQFWLVFLEKFGTPTPMGKYQKHVTQAEREKLLQAVQSVHTDSALVIPEGMEISLIEAARAGTVDYKAFYKEMQQAITTIVLSETMTTDDGSSKSQAQVHMEVRKEIVAADAHLVDDSFNRQVATWLTGWNFPGAAVPKVKRIMDDQPNLKQQAERDKLIFDMGYRPAKKYLEDTYGIELDDAPVPAPANPAPPNSDSADFADSIDFAQGDPQPLDALEEVMDAIDENEWERLAAPLILPILRRAKDDPDSITKDLAALYPALNAKDLENQLARLLFVADTVGRLSAEKKNADLLRPAAPAPGRAPDRGRDPVLPAGGDPSDARIPDRDRRPVLPADGDRAPAPAGDAPSDARVPERGRDPVPPSRGDAPSDARVPAPAGDQPGDRVPDRDRRPVPPSGGGRPPGRRPAPPGPINLGYAVRLPPRRAIEYFQQKGFAITWRWWEAWQEAHNKAFTVAKVTRQDILETIRAALEKALAEGQTEAQFIKELQPLLEKAGWWGRQRVVSPDGIEEIVQLGSPRRLQTIFRTNMRTAYAAARYRQQKENVDSRPYWQYIAIMDERTRHSHAALNEKVFRHDDPIWDTIYPPNGFNCRCLVIALSPEDLKEQKLQVSNSEGNLHEISQEVGVDKATGEVIYRPGTRYDFIDDAGNPQSMTPDPGWNYNPGKHGPRFMNKRLANNRAAALKRETIKHDLNSPKFKGAFEKGNVKGWDLAVLPDDVAQALRDRGVKLPGQIVTDGIPAGKLARKHRNVSVEQYQALQRALDQGGVYLQAPGLKKKTSALLAEYRDANGRGWLYAIDLQNMRTRTIFETNAQYRARKFSQQNVDTIREWDPRRWEEK